jgi:hypothetical protein
VGRGPERRLVLGGMSAVSSSIDASALKSPPRSRNSLAYSRIYRVLR